MKSLSQVLENIQFPSEAKTNNTLPTLPHGLMRADGKMNTPEMIDQQIKAVVQSWPSLSVNYRKTGVYSEEYGFLRTRLTPELKSTDSDSLKELYRLLEMSCIPCPKEDIIKQLYAMSLSMARRKDQDDDFKMMVAVYAGDLHEYPKDVILEVCKEIRRERKFFPVIKDIREACEEKFEFRRALLRELSVIISGAKLLSAG